MSLSKERRDALPDSDFGVPGKRALPIHDERHVRMAWSQLPRTQGLSDSEREEARSRIIHKAKALGIDVSSWELHALAFNLEAMSLAMPDVEGHPNRMPFSGILTRIDEPSDAPPNGSTGKRTYIPRDVAERAIPSLLGMAIDYTEDFDGHDKKAKIGVITEARVEGNAIGIAGFLYASDFPEECARIKAEKNRLGFSYECLAAISDQSADPWVVEHCVFTGAAVLYKHLAAYTTTSLAAQAEQELEMTKEELLAALAEANKPLAAAVETLTGKVAELEAKGASLAGPIIDQVKPHVDALNAAADSMEKAGVGTHATAGHVGVVRRVAAHMAAAAVSGNVPHIYRDHDYLPGATVEAAADKAAAQKAISDAVAAAVKPLQEALEASQTKLTDLQAKAFATAQEPERKTISPAIKTLLAKGGIAEAEVADGKKLTVEQVDKALEAAGVKGTKAIEAKLKMRHEGLMVVGQA
ncbi:hypothetical protein FUT88_13425 [Ralstonia sp. TCR112]|uniref:DUF6582 domain-containing protein n=1 Tax=Ralstonia sp. TCR112 TaxID=2601730 RepID=UPI0011BE3A3F|nr:DUF6582 domain-containing protein [Ralstonia sp. TCR112]TXD58872.1 hypothetical protein FUT88_13425 [Ralstonia sp. TCR112]